MNVDATMGSRMKSLVIKLMIAGIIILVVSCDPGLDSSKNEWVTFDEAISSSLSSHLLYFFPYETFEEFQLPGISSELIGSLNGIIIAGIKPAHFPYNIDTEGSQISRITAIFRDKDTLTGFRDYITLGGVPVNEKHNLFKYYEIPDEEYNITYDYGQIIGWSLKDKSEATYVGEFRLQNNLYPVTLNGKECSPNIVADTISPTEKLLLEWGNADSSTTIILNYEIDNHLGHQVSDYVITGIQMKDEGSYVFDSGFFNTSEINPGDEITIHIIRMTFDIETNASQSEKIGILSFTHSGFRFIVGE